MSSQVKETNEQINISEIIRRVIQKKWAYAFILSSTSTVACALILPVPGYYKNDVSLALELGNINEGGGLSSIAASMGFNLNNTMLSDAISPELYLELLKSNRFISQLIDICVRSLGGTINTIYYNYLDKHQKPNPLAIPLYFLKDLSKKKVAPTPQDHHINHFQLAMREYEIFSVIRNRVTYGVDKKISLISTEVENQDPLISAIVADSVRYKLQEFITGYRTNKARRNMNYYKELTTKAKHTYKKTRQAYGNYTDADMDIMLGNFKSKKDDLENDMQLKFNAYSTLNTQLQAAIAEAQEKTPVSTVVTNATVPLKPAGPKRMMFVAGILFLTLVITTVYVSRDLIS